MTTLRWVAIVAMLAAMSTSNLSGQDFSKFNVAASAPETSEDVAKAVYASLSDMEGEADAKQVAYESLNDAAAYGSLSDSTPRVSAIPATAPATGYLSDGSQAIGAGISQVSLLGPACGLPGGCSDPGCCGVGPGCGLPNPVGLLGPGCGLPEPSCGAAGGCSSCGSTMPCGSRCLRKCPSCCGVGTHYSHIYGEALYLRARNAEVAYAVPTEGPIAAGPPVPIQVGNLGVLDPDYELGFRAGINIALDTVSSIDVRYTLFESLTHDESSAEAPLVLQSLVSHPSTDTASQDGLAAKANLEIDFDMIDVSFRQLFKCCELLSVNYVIGGRYAKLEQQFDAEFLKNGVETISTDIDFDGAGLRLGLETQRFSCRNQLHVYANGYASFLAGRFRAKYFNGQAFDPEVVNAEWEAGRIVPILDLEAGVGWTSVSGKLSLSAGYMVSAWFNTVTTQDYVNAIQTNDYLNLSDVTSFDGLQARFSYRF